MIILSAMVFTDTGSQSWKGVGRYGFVACPRRGDEIVLQEDVYRVVAVHLLAHPEGGATPGNEAADIYAEYQGPALEVCQRLFDKARAKAKTVK